jgi:hypothetical protein
MGYEEETEYEEVSTGKGLRAQLEAALAKLEAAETKLAAKEKAERETSLKSFFESKGLNPKIIEILPASVNSTETAEEFLNSYAEVFGFAAKESDEESKPFNLAEAASAQRLQNLANTGQRPSSIEDLQARIAAGGKDALKILQESKDLFL